MTERREEVTDLEAKAREIAQEYVAGALPMQKKAVLAGMRWAASACEDIANMKDTPGEIIDEIHARFLATEKPETVNAGEPSGAAVAPSHSPALSPAPLSEPYWESFYPRGLPNEDPFRLRAHSEEEAMLANMNQPSPHLSDAEILERAAEIIERETGHRDLAEKVRYWSGSLRARAAQEADPFEAAAAEYLTEFSRTSGPIDPGKWGGKLGESALAVFLRLRFGPWREALEAKK